MRLHCKKKLICRIEHSLSHLLVYCYSFLVRGRLEKLNFSSTIETDEKKKPQAYALVTTVTLTAEDKILDVTRKLDGLAIFQDSFIVCYE